jgi:hypothetical protein
MRFLTRMIAAMVLGAGAAVPVAAEQACTIRVESLQGTDWRIKGFDLLDRRPAQAQFIVNFKHVSGPACEFVPQIAVPDRSPGLRGPGNDRAPYTLTAGDNSTGIRVTGASSALLPAAQGAVIALQPGGARSVTYTLFVPVEGIKGDGSYEQDIEISALPVGRTMGAFGVLLARLGVEVMPSARLGLAGNYRVSGGQAVIDLGELQTGPVSAPLQLRVDSTSRYDLTIESRNGGKLMIPGTDWAVAYALSVGGMAVPLTGGSQTVEPPSRKGLARTALPMQFTITGDPTRQRAGTYEDVLTISITPRV